MRLKYYLRGLGIGIAVTAVVLGFTGNNTAEMTDAQIIERAKELGMQEAEKESGLLLDKNKEPETTVDAMQEAEGEQTENMEEISEEVQPEVESEDVSEAKQPEEGSEEALEAEQPEEDSEEASEAEQPVTENTETPVVEETPEDTQETVTESEAVEQMIVITIHSGDSSVTVSKRVAEAGLVESATAYDRFLCQNGYDKKLAVGRHEIPVGATEEEIAVILTTRRK